MNALLEIISDFLQIRWVGGVKVKEEIPANSPGGKATEARDSKIEIKTPDTQPTTDAKESA